jgi:hypothetical protein
MLAGRLDLESGSSLNRGLVVFALSRTIGPVSRLLFCVDHPDIVYYIFRRLNERDLHLFEGLSDHKSGQIANYTLHLTSDTRFAHA